jgi:hypothetical protein
LVAASLDFPGSERDNVNGIFAWNAWMFFRKTLAVGASVVLGLTLAQVDAGARGGGHAGGHGFAGHFPDHGFAEGHGHFDEHGDHGRGHDGGHEHDNGHDRDHDRDRGRDHGRNDRHARSAMGGSFDHWRGASLSGHFGVWQPGQWHAATGFGSRQRWSPALQGVWGR